MEVPKCLKFVVLKMSDLFRFIELETSKTWEMLLAIDLVGNIQMCGYHFGVTK